ncbi:MAG: hypothetical protein NXI04_09935 [Planctomycetaceae bacterium]|nr:hypothetical protein [Planctomycetaceae bacterium]
MKTKKRLLKSDRLWLFAALLLLLLQFWWLPGAPRTPDDTFSSTIAGQRGFFQTLQALANAGHLPSVERTTDRLVPEEPCTLIVLSPDRYPNEYEQEELTRFVREGGNLLFAPNWVAPNCRIPALRIETTETYFAEEDTVVPTAAPASPAPTMQAEKEEDAPEVASSAAQEGESKAESDDTPDNLRDVQDAIARDGTQPELITEFEETIEATVADLKTSSPLVEGSVKWRTRAGIQFFRTDPTVLVQTGAGTPQAATWDYGLGNVLLCASADIFSNRSMLFRREAELAVRLVERLHETHDDPAGTKIVVSEYLNASDSYRGTGVLMNPGLRSGTLQLILLAVLAGWFGFHRFGPAEPDTAAERRTLTESASAVGNLFFRTHSGGEAVARYLDYVRSRIQEQFGSSVRLEDTKLIARRCGLEPDDVRERVDQAIGLSGSRSTTPPQAATAIRQLSDVMKRLSGARGD